jgi:Sulfotransferase family
MKVQFRLKVVTTVRSQPLIIFLHLPKAAGSTLAHIIQRQYDSTSILPLYESMLGEELAAIPQSQMDRLRIVTGHLYFGVHTFSSRPCTYITMLREPIDRVISHYYFVRHDPSNYLYDLARTMSLKEFVESRGRQEPNNDQTRLLAGPCDMASFGICTDEMLDIAKRNLAQHCAVIGITEEFDRSLLLMKQILGWRTPFYIKQNISRHRLRKESIPLETLCPI